MYDLLKELLCILLELEIGSKFIDVKTTEGIPVLYKQRLFMEMGITETLTDIL